MYIHVSDFFLHYAGLMRCLNYTVEHKISFTDINLKTQHCYNYDSLLKLLFLYPLRHDSQFITTIKKELVVQLFAYPFVNNKIKFIA